MLKKQFLFELIKSLDIHEKRYLVAKGAKSGEGNSAYVNIIKGIYDMQEYDEAAIKKIISASSTSVKTDVKKHYLYYWVLKQLHDFHSDQYKSSSDLGNIMLLKDKSLYQHALSLIPDIKQRLIEQERYPELFILLENELKISRYHEAADPNLILNELTEFSKQYRDYTIYETLKFQFRKILDRNMFMREESDKKKSLEMMAHPFLGKNYQTEGVLNKYSYNLLNYWAAAHINNWEKAFDFAKNNFKHMTLKKSNMLNFPEHYLFSIYNLLNAHSMTGHSKSNTALLELRNLMKTKLSSRIKNDAFFYFNLSKLISQNKNPTLTIGREIEEAEAYILKNEKNFSRINLNHFYFDLAKCFFNSGDIQKAFTYFNEIYQNLNVKGHTIDFYVHSRLLFCLCCFELREFELMIYSAKATNEFVKRNRVMYGFEKRMLKFLIREIPKAIGDKKDKLLIFKKLSADLATVFGSEYERSVLNYFDYENWINDKIKNLERFLKSSNN
jgi:hypothetical protein